MTVTRWSRVRAFRSEVPRNSIRPGGPQHGEIVGGFARSKIEVAPNAVETVALLVEIAEIESQAPGQGR